MTKWCVKDGVVKERVSKWCVRDGEVKDGVSKMVCDKVVCERWCVEDGVCKMVCDKVMCERWCATKLCVKDGVRNMV